MLKRDTQVTHSALVGANMGHGLLYCSREIAVDKQDLLLSTLIYFEHSCDMLYARGSASVVAVGT